MMPSVFDSSRFEMKPYPKMMPYQLPMFMSNNPWFMSTDAAVAPLMFKPIKLKLPFKTWKRIFESMLNPYSNYLKF